MRKILYYAAVTGLAMNIVCGKADAQNHQWTEPTWTPIEGYGTEILQSITNYPNVDHGWGLGYGDDDFPSWPSAQAEVNCDGSEGYSERNCESLGYIQTTSDCQGKANTLSCPFDETKKFCGGKISNCEECNTILSQNRRIERSCANEFDEKMVMRTSESCVTCDSVRIYKLKCEDIGSVVLPDVPAIADAAVQISNTNTTRPSGVEANPRDVPDLNMY